MRPQRTSLIIKTGRFQFIKTSTRNVIYSPFNFPAYINTSALLIPDIQKILTISYTGKLVQVHHSPTCNIIQKTYHFTSHIIANRTIFFPVEEGIFYYFYHIYHPPPNNHSLSSSLTIIKIIKLV